MYWLKNPFQQVYNFPKLSQVIDICSKQIKNTSKIVISVSWWADSSLIFHIILSLLKSKQIMLKNIFVCHVNHKARLESDNEEIYLRQYCKEHWINFIACSYSWNTHNELSYRNARQQFFRNIISHRSWEVVFISWHHLDDRIETSIMNKKRWSWNRWIINMTQVKNITTRAITWKILHFVYLRPLIYLKKDQITHICDKVWLKYFIDNSNFDVNYTLRNKIRKQNKNNLTKNDYIYYIKLYKELEKEMKIYVENLSIVPCISYWSSVEEYYKIWMFSNIETLQELLNFMWIYNNISKWFLNEITTFLWKNKGFKYVRGWYIFRCHWQTYIIKSKKKFWQEDMVLPYVFDVSWNQRKTIIWDRFRGKNINKFFINQKIPIFLRNHIPVIEVWWEIISTLYKKNILDSKFA